MSTSYDHLNLDARHLREEILKAIHWLRSHPEFLAQALREGDAGILLEALVGNGHIDPGCADAVLDQQLRRLIGGSPQDEPVSGPCGPE